MVHTLYTSYQLPDVHNRIGQALPSGPLMCAMWKSLCCEVASLPLSPPVNHEQPGVFPGMQMAISTLEFGVSHRTLIYCTD